MHTRNQFAKSVVRAVKIRRGRARFDDPFERRLHEVVRQAARRIPIHCAVQILPPRIVIRHDAKSLFIGDTKSRFVDVAPGDTYVPMVVEEVVTQEVMPLDFGKELLSQHWASREKFTEWYEKKKKAQMQLGGFL